MKRIILAVTGASGAIYALRTLRALLIGGNHVDLIVSEYGWMLLREEGRFGGKRESFVEFLVDRYGEEGVNRKALTLNQFVDLSAPIASGSVPSDGMVIVPCSMKTLSAVARGSSGNLIERAADVTLKEKRPLVLVPRETPLNLIHLKNLVSAAEAGACIVPAMPAFYQNPKSFDDMADFISGRILNLLNIPHTLFSGWKQD